MANTRKSQSSLAERVAGALAQRIPQGSLILVGLSGGMDSVVLLHLLHTLAPRFSWQLSALHVHHGISPNADAWTDFCTELCARYRVALHIEKVDLKPLRDQHGIEAAARKLRHDAFAQQNCDFVALAHHADDQAETLLLQLLRGAGIKGVAAMPLLKSASAHFPATLRPLLEIPRSTLLAFANQQGLSWVEDESNADDYYPRNFLRRNVLPCLEEKFPAYRATMARSALHFAEASELLDELARQDGAGFLSHFPTQELQSDNGFWLPSPSGRGAGGEGVCVPINLLVAQRFHPHPSPLDETTSQSTKLPNAAAKALVIPESAKLVAGHPEEGTSPLGFTCSIQANKERKGVISHEGEGGQLPVACLRALSYPRAKNLLRYFLHTCGARMPQTARLDEMLNQLLEARDDAAVCIESGGWQVRLYQNRVYVLRTLAEFDRNLRLSWNGEGAMEWPASNKKICFTLTTGQGIKLNKLQAAEVTLRFRSGGESLRPQPDSATRSLKNILQEHHVPPWQRERLPLLFCGEELVCVVGVAIAADYLAEPQEASLLVSAK